jgi:autotransporter-associated beta strand protein
LILSGLLTDAYSATRTWAGASIDTNWQTVTNWRENVVPVAGDDLVFPAANSQSSSNNDFSPFTVFRSITFEGGAYNISGNPFGLTDGLMVNGGSQGINTTIILNAAQTFSVVRNSAIMIAAISFGEFPLMLNGGGNFTIELISGAGALTKNGLGVSLIASANNYEGAIDINGGILIVDADIPRSPVTVNRASSVKNFNPGELRGTGTVGETNILSGAVSPGTLTSSRGILNINDSLNFTANGNYICEIGGTTPGATGHDQLNVVGTVSLNNARLLLPPFGGYRPAIGDSFVILRNDGNDPVNGTFQEIPENSVIPISRNLAFRITYRGGDGNDIVISRVNRTYFDFDNDDKSDISVFRPENGTWYLNQSTQGFRAVQFGVATDVIVPADYDGDNRTDIAVFRPLDTNWYMLRSSDNTFANIRFGASEDIPVPNDFDGDGRADLAVFRPSNGTWYQLRSNSTRLFVRQFGQSGDKPLVGDFDGDGLGDLAVFRNGNWYLLESANASFREVLSFGSASDRPIPADYDGDGITDIAFYRPANGGWYRLGSSSSKVLPLVRFGTSRDIPVPADYDGDGKSDIALFRPNIGVWYILRSTQGFISIQFGRRDDKPVPSAYIQ